MTSGKPLLGIKPQRPLNVFLWCGEDPQDELERRVEAARMLHGLTDEDMGGKLYLMSGRDTEIKTAVSVRGGLGAEILQPVVRTLIQQFTEHQIDVAIFDPFISSHGANENDNGQIDMVVKEWGKVASEANSANGGCSIELSHHVRKASAGQERTIEDGRGASAAKDAMRDARLLVKMTPKEADALMIEPDEVWRYFRVGDAKSNMAPPASKSVWFELASVHLGNADKENPSDSVGVVRLLKKTSPFEGVRLEAIEAMMKAMRGNADGWRSDKQATHWFGYFVGESLGLDVGENGEKEKSETVKRNRRRVNGMISAWIAGGRIRETTGKDSKGMDRKMIVIGNWFEDSQ